MRYNQYSYTKASTETMLTELSNLGFDFQATNSPKENLLLFLKRALFGYQNIDTILSNMVADNETDLLAFFESNREQTDEVFYTIALQLLGFTPFVDFENVADFCKEINFPITYGNIL